MRVCGRLPGNILSRHTWGLGRRSPGGFCALGGDGIESVIYDGQEGGGGGEGKGSGGRERAGATRGKRKKVDFELNVGLRAGICWRRERERDRGTR